jgi:hypothetical protein
MTTSSRPQRKKKPTDIFTPISREEEKSLMQALNISLRRIPLDGSVSDDDIGSDEEEKVEEDHNDDNIDEKNTAEEYELKWSKQRSQVTVADFIQASGPTKVLSSQQNVKSFFELMFSKKVLYLICSQTNNLCSAMYSPQTRPCMEATTSWGAKSLDRVSSCHGA